LPSSPSSDQTSTKPSYLSCKKLTVFLHICIYITFLLSYLHLVVLWLDWMLVLLTFYTNKKNINLNAVVHLCTHSVCTQVYRTGCPKFSLNSKNKDLKF
jgi:hypothetical protein